MEYDQQGGWGWCGGRPEFFLGDVRQLKFWEFEGTSFEFDVRRWAVE